MADAASSNASRCWERVILHADMDAFYAAIEQLDRPELRGRPVLVGAPSGRGVVATASYEARPYGVGSAMPMARARRLCPEAVVVRPRFARYAELSERVMAVFARFSPLVEPLSLDEAFIDLSGTGRALGHPEAVGRQLKQAVWEATGLTVSVGIAPCKFVAKLASDADKPDGLTSVPPRAVAGFLAPLGIERMWGVGERTLPRLQALGLHTLGDVARAKPESLKQALGRLGEDIWHLARGDDPRVVVPHRDPKSIGSEATLEDDIAGRDAVFKHLLPAADTVGRRLRESGRVARGVRVKIKRSDFRLLTRQMLLKIGRAHV